MMSTTIRHRLNTTALCLVLASATGCETVGPLLLPSCDQIAAVYEALAREWLRWVLEIPHGDSPLTDSTGERCAVGQGEGPWFLAGTYGGDVVRRCTIPANKPLFFPLVNHWVLPSDELIEGSGNYREYMAWLVHSSSVRRAHTCNLLLRIDGEDLLADTAERDAELYIAVTRPFSIELAHDNFWVSRGRERPGGTYEYATVDGHWALLRPLEPGNHTLEFGGTICDDAGEVSHRTRATYYLYVEGMPAAEG